MALPVILVNSATGSDSAASGAGPTTALTGSSASTDGAGTVVTLDGSPDLSGVATDGSAVIYLADGTAGARNFGKITTSDNSAKTVTVEDAFGLSLSGLSWAIGGKRASVGGTASTKLMENNGAAGDAMPGWAIRMESGHSETIATTKNFRRSGSTAAGRIILEGDPDATTRPLLTFSNNGSAINVVNGIAMLAIRNFELRNSNATKTASVALNMNVGSGGNFLIENMVISDATDRFWKGIQLSSGRIVGSLIANCASDGVALTGASNLASVFASRVRDNGGNGITDSGCGSVFWCLIHDNTGDGMRRSLTGSGAHSAIHDSVFHGNGGDGFESTNTSAQTAITGTQFINCVFTSNGGYGLHFSGSGINATILEALGVIVRNNNHYNNTSGWCNISLSVMEVDTYNIDPDYVNAAAGDLTPQAATLEGAAYPMVVDGVNSFDWPGAIQPEDAGGGGGGPLIGGRLVR